ncbi:MAG TPA: hypothetical protein VK568_12445 [Thermodesulfobacteriota bacterium]|jgi:hypothetical protein|nr:hypothetical protein [Thermodesulfobacteriota bacterium]
MESTFFITEDDKRFLSSFLTKEENEGSVFKHETSSDGRTRLSLPVYFVELFNRIKASLSAMQAFAFLSRENFKDRELGEHFYKIVNEDIAKTISLIDCFNDYINFSTPVVKRDTVNTLVEEVIKKHERQFEEKRIKVIKKQFEKDLPETILPDEQLRYILNSVIQYALLSVPPDGSIGFLTRLLNMETLKGQEWDQLQKDGRYLEVLVVSAGYEKPDEETGVVSEMPNAHQEEAVELILRLAKEIIEKNKGMMRYKVYEDKPMTFISLILPVERRNVVRYLSPEERLKKTMASDK